MKITAAVEKFSEKEGKFGIKLVGMDKWINGFGKCPQEIKEGVEATIPYYEVEKEGWRFLNYGEPRARVDIGAELKAIRSELAEIKEMLKTINY